MKTVRVAAMAFFLGMIDPCASGLLVECWRDGRLAYVRGQEACAQLDEKAFISSEHKSDDPLVMAALAFAREVVMNISMGDESGDIHGERVYEDLADRGMRDLVSVAVDWSNLLGDNTFRLKFYSINDNSVLLYVDPVSRKYEWAVPLE